MKYLVLIWVFCAGQPLAAQQAKHIVQLTDKHNSPYFLNRPAVYLSPKSIERRNRQGIAIDSTDLPVNPAYVSSILESGTVTLLNTSRWLNQVLIETNDAEALSRIGTLPFVKTITRAAPAKAGRKARFDVSMRAARKQKRTQDSENHFDYGANAGQVSIHEGEWLHNKGYSGEGMTIALLDAGFYQYDTNPAFDSIRLNNQVLDTWDFVKNKRSVTEEHMHGMVCFSTIAANIPGKIVGTATRAQYYLFRTEDVDTEHQVEEQNWVAAAEKADSLGVDIITSSLGYYDFDDASRSYDYTDMDGKTAIITRGAEAAFKKGIIVCNSAGNSGDVAWRYIVAPADGKNVLAVGSVNFMRQVAGSSSYGPSADGRVKPDVASLGWNAVVAGYDGNPMYTSGTSLACPNLAGLIACLWQSFPDMTNAEILDAVKRSADQYTRPDDRVGYGIPNLRIAWELLAAKTATNKAESVLGGDWIKAYPVPFSSSLRLLIKAPRTGNASLVLLNSAGRELFKKKIQVTEGVLLSEQLLFASGLAQGVYWLQYRDGKTTRVIKLLK